MLGLLEMMPVKVWAGTWTCIEYASQLRVNSLNGGKTLH